MKKITLILLLLVLCLTTVVCTACKEGGLSDVTDGTSSETELETGTYPEKLIEIEEGSEQVQIGNKEWYQQKEWFIDLNTDTSLKWNCDEISYKELSENIETAGYLIRIFECGEWLPIYDDFISVQCDRNRSPYEEKYYRVDTSLLGFEIKNEEDLRETMLKYFTEDFTNGYIEDLVCSEKLIIQDGKLYGLDGDLGTNISRGKSTITEVYPTDDGYELIYLTEVFGNDTLEHIGYVKHCFHLKNERGGLKFNDLYPVKVYDSAEDFPQKVWNRLRG